MTLNGKEICGKMIELIEIQLERTNPLISPTNCASAVLTSPFASRMLVQASRAIHMMIG